MLTKSTTTRTLKKQTQKRENTYYRTAKKLKSDNVKLRLKVNIDPLIKLLNRHAFRDFSNQINIEKSSNFGGFIYRYRPLQRINDTYGYACGNGILKQFANLIQDDGTELEQIASSIITNTRNNHWQENITVTCNIGYSVFVQSIGNTIQLADKTLCHAKNSGRDRACGNGNNKSASLFLKSETAIYI
ncbi:diguanylate cyclase [Vibrio alginolyticus]|nr:diguanylate cyclase [Vibrio alginolyticus]